MDNDVGIMSPLRASTAALAKPKALNKGQRIEALEAERAQLLEREALSAEREASTSEQPSLAKWVQGASTEPGPMAKAKYGYLPGKPATARTDAFPNFGSAADLFTAYAVNQGVFLCPDQNSSAFIPPSALAFGMGRD